MTMRRKIEWDAFNTWAKDAKHLYAGESISNGRGSKHKYQLKFWVTARGGFKVTLGFKTLYEGECFGDAADAYNDAT